MQRVFFKSSRMVKLISSVLVFAAMASGAWSAVTDTSADIVLGQPDFVHNAINNLDGSGMRIGDVPN